MSKTPDLIIFDCDGVLVDSEVIFNEVLHKDLTARGLELSLKESMALFHGGSMEAAFSSIEAQGIKLPEGWIETLYASVAHRLEQGVDVVEGIPELLELLKAHAMPFCVASNGPVSKMQITLGQNNLLPYFKNAMFSGYDIESWKPEPDLFLHAAASFSIRPENCVVIEDSATGALAAKNAQMPCIAYSPEGPNEKLMALNATCFSSMSDVPTLIGLTVS